MLFLALLISTALSGTYVGDDSFYADIEDARASCTGQGMDLCTYGQLYQVAFTNADYNQPQMCLSGFMDDGSVGWWNADAEFCSGYGYKTYARAEPGAHCCSADIPDTVPATCQTSDNPCLGTRILSEATLSLYCADGDCTDDFCCEDFTPADIYKNVGGYTYENVEQAQAGCEALHPDLQLCTRTQIDGIYASGQGAGVCASGWHFDEDGNAAKGWMVNDEEAASGFCGGVGGWRAWAPSSGLASAHCCVPSYTNGGYYPTTTTSTQEMASDYCNGLNGYPYTLCSTAQLLSVAASEGDSLTCMSGYVSDGCGWQNSAELAATGCAGGTEGWKGWCATYAGAHCCMDYVQDYVPDYTYSDDGYDLHPVDYTESDFNSGAAAAAWCVEKGYGGICSTAQVKYTSDNGYANADCKVGWATNDGAYTSGYWGTACGRDDKWYDAWQPSVGNPGAHCCNEDVPAAATVADPVVKQTATYDYATFDQASGNCGEGYNVCTRDQVETVATIGVEREDGSTQLEEHLCYQGWMADGSKGWYQGKEGPCGGAAGWRAFNGNAGLFCCTDFETALGTPAPTAAPAIPVYTFLGLWVYPYGDADSALAACEAENAAYGLCSDDEVVEITMNGAEVDAEGVDGVAAQTTYPGWCDPDTSGENTNGRYLNGAWNSWSSGGNSGAHCCVPGLINAPAFPETEAPTEAETTTTTTSAPETTTAAPETTTTSAAPETTEFVPYSDLPSTQADPEDCLDRSDLIPEGFEGVVQYCATSDLIYINGQTTCVDPSDVDADSMVRDAFENDWYFAAGQCDGQKEYETATDDQLFVTNHMLNELEADIDQLEADMATSSSDLDAYLEQWKAEVAALIDDNMQNFDETTQDALQNYVDANLS